MLREQRTRGEPVRIKTPPRALSFAPEPIFLKNSPFSSLINREDTPNYAVYERNGGRGGGIWRDKTSALWRPDIILLLFPVTRKKESGQERCEAEKCVLKIFLSSLGETGWTGTEVVRPDNGRIAVS